MKSFFVKQMLVPEEISVWERVSGLHCRLWLPVSRGETHINQPFSPEYAAEKIE